MAAPSCHQCGRFVKPWGARHMGEGYAATWYAIGICKAHGEVGIDWEWLGEDFDPERADANA